MGFQDTLPTSKSDWKRPSFSNETHRTTLFAAQVVVAFDGLLSEEIVRRARKCGPDERLLYCKSADTLKSFAHAKIIVRFFEDDQGRSYGVVYAGSHNMSTAAWGARRRV